MTKEGNLPGDGLTGRQAKQFCNELGLDQPQLVFEYDYYQLFVVKFKFL